MSLRTFHIFFIGLSTAMCFSVAALIMLVAQEEAWAAPGIAASVLSAAALVLYGRRFLKKYGALLPKM